MTSSFPYYTPYQFSGNTPIQAIDLDGLEQFFVTRWYENGRFYSDVMLEVASASGSNSTGETAVYGQFKDAARRVQYTTTDRSGNISTSYSPTLAPHEKRGIDTDVRVRGLNGRGGVNPGIYNSTVSIPSPIPTPTPPPPPPPPAVDPTPPPTPPAPVSAATGITPSTGTTPPSSPPIPPTSPPVPPTLVSIDFQGVAFDRDENELDRPDVWQWGSDDITDLLAPAVGVLGSDPTANIIITVGTSLPPGHSHDNYGTVEKLLEARFQEVLRQMKIVNPNLDTGRVQQQRKFNSQIKFEGTISTQN